MEFCTKRLIIGFLCFKLIISQNYTFAVDAMFYFL